MAYSITINGVDRTTDIINTSPSIDDILNDQQNTATLILIDRSGNGIPQTDQEVVITLSDSTILFGGYILSVDLESREYGEVVAVLQCSDYVQLFDSNLVHQTYENMTDKEIIEDIVERYCAGFGITTNNVIEGVTISQITFNYLQPSQCLRKIAELTGRNWYIDYEKDIHYFPLSTNAAPFDIREKTYYINESMSASPSGTIAGDATYDSTNHFLKLTPAANTKLGSLRYTNALASAFLVEADVWAGGGSGADAIWWYWGCSSVPSSEDQGVGYGGYIVAIDEYSSNQLQIWFNGSLLSSVVLPFDIDNSTRRTLRIRVDGTNIKVEVNGITFINYTDTTRSLGGSLCGVGARTGGSNNEHRLYTLYVYYYPTGYNLYENLRIKKDASQIRNRVYVRGGTYLSDPTTYSEKGDGVKKKFPLPDKPHDVSVTVNGVSKTVGIKNIDTSGYDWYVNFQEKYIEQDSGASALASTDTLAVTYTYDIPILVAVEDTASIAENGVREFAVFDKAISTTQSARDRASAELTDYANDLNDGSFETYTTGFRSGQYIHIARTAYDVDDDYIIQSVHAQSEGGGVYKYTVKFASAKTMGIIKFLIKLLEANKNLIELDPNEVVDNLFALTDALISDSLTDTLTIDSAGPYSTWCTDSLQSSPSTRARWDLFQWG